MVARRSYLALATASFLPRIAWSGLPETLENVRRSVVPIGYFKATNNPRFGFRGTGFVVGTGLWIATNAHVLMPTVEEDREAALVALIQSPGREPELRRLQRIEVDPAHDLALLRVADGAPLTPMNVQASDGVREGQLLAFTGFPIGGVFGFRPVTHRGIVSSITPAALPAPTTQRLTDRAIRSLRDGTFNLFQLDATAYPGNSGGPLYDPDTGAVVGVINMVLVKGNRESALSSPTGISYAIPARHLLDMMARAPAPR